MKDKRRSNLERLQDSVSYVPEAMLKNRTDVPNRTRYFNELYPHMLIEDVKLGIMPIGGRSPKKQFRVSLEPPDSSVQRIIETALSPSDYHNELASEVCDFVAQCAVELLLFDSSTYEIVYLSEQQSAKVVGFELVHINPVTLFQRGNALVQELPSELAAKLGKPQHIALKPERVLTFKLPESFRSKADPLMEALWILSAPTAPDFVMQEMASGSIRTPYEASTHIHMHRVALASTARFCGWNARLLFQDEALEYYLVHRSLLFERFKIELREAILETLREGIKTAGSKLGFKAEIVVSGLPTIDDVQFACDRLRKGDASFAAVLEPFRVY